MPIPAGGVIYPGRDEPTNSVEVEAAFGANLLADPATWSWTDLSSRMTAEPIRNRAGRSSGAGQVSPGTLTAALLNDDGALTPRNPTSPYWPNVTLGTPLRARLRRAEDAFARTVSGGWGTATSGQAWTTGGTAAADFSVSGGVAQHSHPTVNNIRRTTLAVSLADSEQVVDVAPSALLTGAALVTGLIFRYSNGGSDYYWLRCEFNSGGTTVMLKLTKCVGGSFTDLGSLNPVPGVPYAANTYLRVRASVVGTRLAMKVWNPAGAEPAGWQLTATDTAITVAGAAGLQSWLVLGTTNTLPVTALHKNYALRVDLANRFADQWEPTFAPIRPGESASAVRVTASGLLRRLDQGVKPARSSPARFIPTTNPVGYWPLEDGQLVSEGAALVGGEPMRPFVGTHPSGAVVTFAQWGRGELAPWLPDAVSRTGNHGLAIIWSPVRMSATSQWCIDFMHRSGTDASSSGIDVNPSYLPDGALGWPQLTLLPDGQGVDVSMNGEPEIGGTAPTLFDGQPHHVRWYAYQDGAKVSWGVYVDGVGVNGGTTSGNMTLPPVTTVGMFAAAQAGADIAQGHLAVWAANPNHPDCVSAAFGHVGELAAARVARLCAEEGISVSVLPGYSEPLGPQPTAGVMDLLREAEEADMGVLFELGFGLGYRPREARYNTATSVTVDLATYAVSDRGGDVLDVLSPTYDDQDLRNEWTVSRRGGRSETAADTVHQQRSGVYDDSADLNVASDGVLADHAWWRLHLGTFDGLREDSFPLDLAANPGLVDGWLSCGVGSRIVRTNPPSQYGPEPLDRLVEGWTETIGPRSWIVQVTPSPAQPWDVATVDGTQRVAADGSTLAADLTAGGTSLLLASTADNGPWTTNASDTPLDVRVGGERVTASAIAPAVADVFSRTVSNGWGTANSGQAWTTTGGSASEYSVSGGTAQHVHNGVGVLHQAFIAPGGNRDFTMVTDVTIPVMPTGAAITVWVVIREVDTSNYYTAQLGISPGGSTTLTWFKRVGGSLTSLAAGVNVGTHTAGASWRISAAIFGTTLMAKAWLLSASDPGWQTTATDSAITAGTQVGVLSRLETGNTNTLPVTISVDNFTVTNPQTATLSARAVNGVTRAWPAGTDVDVWQPAIAAL